MFHPDSDQYLLAELNSFKFSFTEFVFMQLAYFSKESSTLIYDETHHANWHMNGSFLFCWGTFLGPAS